MSPTPQTADRPTLAVVGATGATGRVVLNLLPLRDDLWGTVKLAAAPDDVGSRMQVLGREVEVEALRPGFFDGVDVALFDLPPGMALTWAPVAVAHGAVVVDNSSDWRLDEDVPLVVTGVNAQSVADRSRGIIAVPGATVMTVIDALGVLHAGWELDELVLTTFQAASGLGRQGISRLYDEIELVAGDRSLGQLPGDVRRLIESELGESAFPAPLALNVIPWVGSAAEDGWTSEETRVRDEVRKILGIPDLRVSATCVRVPVVTTHSVSVHARFTRRITPDKVRRALIDAPSIVVLDEPDHHEFPTPADVVGSDPRFAGRIRQPSGMPRAIDFFICGDNLRSGSAVTMVELAEAVRGDLVAPH